MSFRGNTYGRKTGGGSRANNPFDRFMKEQCNKPVASKSAGIVGKWGQTSYTSLRTATGEKRDGENIPRPKKFFKSRTTTENDNVVGYADDSRVPLGQQTSPGRHRPLSGQQQTSPGRHPATPSPELVTVSSAKIIKSSEKQPQQRNTKKIFTSRNKRSDSVERSARPSSRDVRKKQPAAVEVPGYMSTPTAVQSKFEQLLEATPPPAVKSPRGHAPSPSHPPIKLKLSLSKSPYKGGDGGESSGSYHVVRSRQEQQRWEEEQEEAMSSAASCASESSETSVSQSGSERLSGQVHDSDAASDMSNGYGAQHKASYSSGGYGPDSDTDSVATSQEPTPCSAEPVPTTMRSPVRSVRNRREDLKNNTLQQPCSAPSVDVIKQEPKLEVKPEVLTQPTAKRKPPLERQPVIEKKPERKPPLERQPTVERIKIPLVSETPEEPVPEKPKPLEVPRKRDPKIEKPVVKPPPSPPHVVKLDLGSSDTAESSIASKGDSQSEKAAPEEPSINFPARITHVPNRNGGEAKPLKRSIFKSKAKENGPQPIKKSLSMYKHKMGWGGDKEELKKVESLPSSSSASSAFDMDFDSEPMMEGADDAEFAPGMLTRVSSYPTSRTGLDESGEMVTSVKCPKSYKEYFTVIKNVKKAHEINDFGENQEFNDDVDYILDGLSSRHSVSTRCLATISLATKCMKPGFRMHLRAHGIVTKFFAELKDAPENHSLALCASTVLFVLSQDRLNMDLDRDSLELMLNLLDTDSKIRDLEVEGIVGKELEKNQQKVVDICSQMKEKGHAASLNLDLISADHLSMETLLSMTSKRAGEWFKEELRELGGLEHLVRTFTDCVNYLTIKAISSWTETLTDKLKKADRVLRVLENITAENEENCLYLVDHCTDDGRFLDIFYNLFQLLLNEVPLHPSTEASDKESLAVILRDTLLSTMRVYINVAHDYRNEAFGSLRVGSKYGLCQGVARCLFIMPEYMPRQKRFDILVLSLTLIINLVEHCDENRQTFIELPAPQKEDIWKEEPRMLIDDFVKLFLDKEELARMSADKTDNILDCVEEEVQEIDPELEKKKEERRKKENKKEKDDGKDSVDETIQKLLSKAGNHMEFTLVAAYVAIIVGHLIHEAEDYEQRFREILPTNNFTLMVNILSKFFNFMKMTTSGTVSANKGLKATERILKYLEAVDTPEEVEEEKEETFTDLTLFDVSNDDTTLQSNQPESSYMEDYGFDEWGKL